MVFEKGYKDERFPIIIWKMRDLTYLIYCVTCLNYHLDGIHSLRHNLENVQKVCESGLWTCQVKPVHLQSKCWMEFAKVFKRQNHCKPHNKYAPQFV